MLTPDLITLDPVLTDTQKSFPAFDVSDLNNNAAVREFDGSMSRCIKYALIRSLMQRAKLVATATATFT